MGCGCKNKSQSQQNSAPQPIASNEALQKLHEQQNETIKQQIKKTVEKYYNVQKKTNGFIPE